MTGMNSLSIQLDGYSLRMLHIILMTTTKKIPTEYRQKEIKNVLLQKVNQTRKKTVVDGQETSKIPENKEQKGRNELFITTNYCNYFKQIKDTDWQNGFVML